MSIMKFYFTPGSCSTGIHILLEELELVFAAYPVNLIKGEQFSAEFLALNPKASVPVLVLPDGRALTDFISIAWWLAKSYPRAGLLDDSLQAEVEALELMNHVINTIHGQGFSRIFTTEKYTSNPVDIRKVSAQGRDIVERGLRLMAEKFPAAKSPKTGLGIVDAAMFYVEFWADRTGITLPAFCFEHYRRMLQRAAVRRVLMEEGYHSTLADHAESTAESKHAIA